MNRIKKVISTVEIIRENNEKEVIVNETPKPDETPNKPSDTSSNTEPVTPESGSETPAPEPVTPSEPIEGNGVDLD